MESQEHPDTTNPAGFIPSTMPNQLSPGVIIIEFFGAGLLTCSMLLILLILSAGDFSVTCQRAGGTAGECRISDYSRLLGTFLPQTTIVPLADIQSADVGSAQREQGRSYGLILNTKSGMVPVGSQYNTDPAEIREYADQINAFLRNTSVAEAVVGPPRWNSLNIVISCVFGFMLLGGFVMGYAAFRDLFGYLRLSPERQRSIAELPLEARTSSRFRRARAAYRPRPKPSLYEILRRDVQTYYLSLIVGIPLIGIVMALLGLEPRGGRRIAFNPQATPKMLAFWVPIALCIILIFVPFLIRRVVLIKRILAKGVDVTGLLVRIPNSNWVKLTIEYSYEGRCFETTQVIRHDIPSPIGVLQVGEEIDLLVDQKDPRKVLLRDLWRDLVRRA